MSRDLLWVKRGAVAPMKVSSRTDGQPYADKDESPPIAAAWMNLTKNLVGAGIFSLPSALLSGSVLPGLMAMVAVCFFCGSSFILIAFLCKRLKCQTYREVWCKAFGPKTGILIDAFIVINGFFACVAYTILVADFLQKVAEGLLGKCPNRMFLIASNTCFFMLPLSHAKDLSALKFTSMICLVIIALVFLYVVSDCLGQFDDAATNVKAHTAHLDMGIFRTIAICTGAFQAHYNAPRIFKQLHCDLKAHTQAVVASFGTALSVYSVFALSGLGLFGNQLLGNVLRNYNADGNVPILLAWLGMAFAIIFTYPLVFTAARDSLIGSQPVLQKAMKEWPTLAHIAITSGMVVAISTVASCIEDVSVVTGTLGAFIGSSLCWICPSSIYLRVTQKSKSDLEQPLCGSKARLPRNRALAAYACFLIAFGAVSIVVGVEAVLHVV